MVRTFTSLALGAVVSASCPDEIKFSYTAAKDDFEIRALMAPRGSFLQRYTKESSLKNERAWYSSEDGKMAMHWCGEQWGVSMKSLLPSKSAPCHHNITLQLNSTAPAANGNLTCPTSSSSSSWYYVSSTGQRVAAQALDLTPATVLGGTCSSHSQCASGRCGNGTKCTCEDDNSVLIPTFGLVKRFLAGKEPRCENFKTMFRPQGIETMCQCSGKTQFYCRELCGSCHGNFTQWSKKRCLHTLQVLTKQWEQRQAANTTDNTVPVDTSDDFTIRTAVIIACVGVLFIAAIVGAITWHLKRNNHLIPEDVDAPVAQVSVAQQRVSQVEQI